MKLRKSIWFALLLSILSFSLSLGNVYGYSIHSNNLSKGFILKKNGSDNQEKPISVFFEEENINENEDELTINNSLFIEHKQSFIFLFHITKVQLFITNNYQYFSRYSNPLFIVFRNLRL